MTKFSHLVVALAATSALGLPAQADQHKHAEHAKSGAPQMDAKKGGCIPGQPCKHGGMQHGGMQHGKGMGGFAHMIVMQSDALKLTDEQIGKLHRIEMRHQEKQAAVAGPMHESMMAMHQSMMDPAADDAAIKKAAAAHATAFQSMVDAALAERTEALSVLTADQKKALKAPKADDAKH